MTSKVIDGQNISLADALKLGFKRLDDQQYQLKDGNKRFVLSNLLGEVREIPVLQQADENIQAGNSANGEQEIKKGTGKARKESEGGDPNPDNIQLAGEPINEKAPHEELSDDRKALEQNGFHIIGEDGFQSGSNNKSNNVNKESTTSPSIITKGNADNSNEDKHNKKSKKS